ncbi:MAG: DUF4235 domain-containing protein [Propionibacteriaceae bacterium]|jgi:hypothetical protein|nr:DUF4235 domain-containing protein [Propionibacteriaceae bacterium]
MDKVIIDKIYTAILSAIVTFVAGFALKKVWELATGSQPPDPQDPQVPARQAVTWFVASGVGVGLAQLLFHRQMSKHLAKPARAPLSK